MERVNVSSYAADLELARRLADAASDVSMSYFRRELRRWSKEDGSLATEADIAVEDTIRARINAERPGDAVLGEEKGQTGSGARRWIVDGIDGTVFFANGDPDWGTLIALEVNGQRVVGVCDEPVHKRRYWASKGAGAFRQHAHSGTPEQLAVTDTRELKTASSFVQSPERLADERMRQIARALIAATNRQPHVDHPALQVAFGGYDVAVFLHAGPWDIAAPALVVEEAGGRVTDIGGRDDCTTGTAVFTNGYLHEDVLRIIASA